MEKPEGSESAEGRPKAKADDDSVAAAAKVDDGASSNGTLLVVFLSLLIDLFAFTMVLPLLPSLMEYYEKHDKDGLYPYLVDNIKYFQRTWKVPDHFNTVFFGGIIGSLFCFVQFMAAPIAGAVSDIYGRKPVILISMIGEVISYAIWACSFDFSTFVLFRLVGGISKCNVSVCTAVVADVTTTASRGRGMALIGAAFSLGFILGPVSGVLFAQWAKAQSGAFFVAPALLALVLVSVDILYVAMFLRESLPREKRTKSLESSLVKALDFINPVSLFAFKPVKNIQPNDLAHLRQLGIVYFLYLFLYSGLEFTLTFLVHLRFQYTSMQQGKMFLFIGIIMAAVQGGYVRRIPADKLKRTALQGIGLIIPSFSIIGLAYQPYVMYVGLALYSFASATVIPSLTTIVSTYGSADQKGVVMGIFRSLGALARALGPLAASCVFWSYGAETSYILGGLLLCLPLLLLGRLKLEKQH